METDNQIHSAKLSDYQENKNIKQSQIDDLDKTKNKNHEFVNNSSKDKSVIKVAILVDK